MDAASPIFRVLILIFASLSIIGCSMPKDAINAMQVLMTRSPNCTTTQLTTGIDCCQDCIGMGDRSYNAMFSFWFVFDTIASICIGILLDKIGNSVIVLTLVSAFLGISLITLGSNISNSPLFLPCMYVGASFAGLAYQSSHVCRDCINLSWFTSKHAGLAIGISACVNRFMSFGVFSLSEKIRESIGLQWTLFVVASVTLMSLLSSVCVTILDNYGTKQLQMSEIVKHERQSMRISDVRRFSVSYWLLVGILATTLAVAYMTEDNATEFVFDKFHMTKQMSGIIGGSARYIGFIVTPFTGLIMDVTGRPSLCILVVSITLTPAFALMGFSPIHPMVTVALAGCLYSMQNVLVCASTSFVVSKAHYGTALSIAFGSSAVMSSLLHLIVGLILGSARRMAVQMKLIRWDIVMGIGLLLVTVSLCLSIAGFVITVKQKQSMTSNDTVEVTYRRLHSDGDADVDADAETDAFSEEK